MDKQGGVSRNVGERFARDFEMAGGRDESVKRRCDELLALAHSRDRVVAFAAVAELAAMAERKEVVLRSSGLRCSCADGDDFTQELWLKLLSVNSKSKRKYRKEGKPVAWLERARKNKFISHVRRDKLLAEAMPVLAESRTVSEMDPAMELHRREHTKLAVKAAKRVKGKAGSALRWHHLRGKAFSWLKDRLGCSQGKAHKLCKKGCAIVAAALTRKSVARAA